MLNSLDGPGENYCEVLNKINSKVLAKDINYLDQDRLAKNMLRNENLVDVAPKERRQCIELTILGTQGIRTMRQLLTNPAMVNHF